MCRHAGSRRGRSGDVDSIVGPLVPHGCTFRKQARAVYPRRVIRSVDTYRPETSDLVVFEPIYVAKVDGIAADFGGGKGYYYVALFDRINLQAVRRLGVGEELSEHISNRIPSLHVGADAGA